MKVFCALASLALFVTIVGGAASNIEDGSWKNYPVSKVVKLLQDMQQQLQKEAEEDEDTYDKVACWCQTNDKAKTQAIQDAENRISDLSSTIEEQTARSARLNTEIQNLKEELSKNVESFDQAAAMRKKQLAEFNGEEKDMLESVSALKAAIVVLSRHHSNAGSSLLDDATLTSIARVVSTQMRKNQALLQGVITPRLRRSIIAFAQSPDGYYDEGSAFAQAPVASYRPQSSEIFGILRQMLETFQSNLSDSQKEELSNQKQFEGVKAGKAAEIKANQDALDKKVQQLANADETLAQAKEDIVDTRASLSADEVFLMDLKKRCQMTDQEWQQRQKTRQEEMSGIAQAIAILSSDEAHDTFSKTYNAASFIQIAKDSSRRADAANLISAVALKTGSSALAMFATQVRIDPFVKVKAAIDGMVVQLAKESQDEIKHKDFCVDELHSNDMENEGTTRDKANVETKIADLKSSITQVSSAIATLKAEVTDLQVQLKRAGEDRQSENKDFQATIADQRETQKLLQKALAVLQHVYASKKVSSSLLQVSISKEPSDELTVEDAPKAEETSASRPPPPPGFRAYEKSQGAGGAVALIQQIINDAKAMEAEAMRGENDAQKAYESFVKETNRSIDAKQKGIVNKTSDRAKANQQLTDATSELESTENELDTIANDAAGLHQNCDFILKNFDIRQEARAEEIQALRQAKAILSGMNLDN